MQNRKSLLLNLTLVLTFGLCVSCLKQSESIDPIAPVKTLAEIQRESMMTAAIEAAGNNKPSDAAAVEIERSTDESGLFYLNMKYKIQNLDVMESANIQNGFESLSNSFIRMLANIFIKLSGGRTVDIGAVEIPLTDLNLDFSVIKSIRVRGVRIDYSRTNLAANDFSFIKTLDIKKMTGEKILTYTKSTNQCGYTCMMFTVRNGSVLDLVKDTNTLKINPTMTIVRIPVLDELKLDGEIDLQVGLKLPF